MWLLTEVRESEMTEIELCYAYVVRDPDSSQWPVLPAATNVPYRLDVRRFSKSDSVCVW